MKKLFTLITILAVTCFSHAVNAQLVAHNPATHATGNDVNSELSCSAMIVNTSADSVVIVVHSSNTSLSSGHLSYFCWGSLTGGTCYPPGTTSSGDFVMQAGDSMILIVNVQPRGSFGTDMVNCTVYDTANMNTNNVSIDFTFDVVAGIKDFAPSKSYIFCSQSATEEVTNITYGIRNFKDARLIVRNLLGSVIKEVKLTEKRGVLSVSSADIPTGIYMYCLYNNGEVVSTQKAVISHR